MGFRRRIWVDVEIRYTREPFRYDDFEFGLQCFRLFDGDHAKWDKKSKKRLIFAGSNPRTCFVYFRGGTSLPIYNLQIFHAGPPTTLAYHGSDTENIYPDLAALRRGYQKHAFLDVSAPPPSK